jgi:hypothetical protein
VEQLAAMCSGLLDKLGKLGTRAAVNQLQVGTTASCFLFPGALKGK